MIRRLSGFMIPGTMVLHAFYVMPGWAVSTKPNRALTPEETRHWPRVVRKDGRKNPVVIAVQYLLRARGHEIVVDGIFGEQTWRKIKKFQSKRKLPVDGIIDDLTWEKLMIEVGIGSQGNAVRAVQARLKGHGHEVSTTGSYGPRTHRAIALFQSGHGNLISTGFVNRATWCHLVNGSVAP